MKTVSPTIPLLFSILFACSLPCLSSNVSISSIEQPVNLVAHSDPTRIPLGPVPVINNYGYGIHYKIFESRPCPQGAMLWKNGSELDQNLAVVFGISIDIPDSTQILVEPSTLHLKAWKPPAYSPYTKEQVLCATIWCLIRSSGGSEKNPLELKIVAEAPEDKWLEKKYSGKYTSYPGEDKNSPITTEVGGTTIEEDARGISWVVLPGTKADKAFKPLSPCLIICGIGEEPGKAWQLLPIWGNGEKPDDFLDMNEYSANMVYSAWYSKGLRNANAFSDLPRAGDLSVIQNDKSIEIRMGYQYAAPEAVAANIYALVLSQQPTEDKPLTIRFLLEDEMIEKYADFRKSDGWNETHNRSEHSSSYEFKCEFVWDSKNRKLIKGSIPCVTLEQLNWIISKPED